MNEKLTITGAADLLATIPHLLGVHPSESIVVLTATDTGLGAALRVDAPVTADPAGYARMMAGYAAHDETATASYLVVYSEETGLPYVGHVVALSDELAAAGMPVRNVWLVTGTYWAEFGMAEELPLDAIRDSNANATLTYFGSAADAGVYDPAGLEDTAPRVEAPAGSDEDLRLARDAWAAVLDGTGLPDRTTARSIAGTFQHKLIRDFLFRDIITTRNGSFGDVMLGKFAGRPDWARVDRAQAIAFELMKAVPVGQRAPMLCLMGWVEWLKGHGTRADRYLKLATEDVPGFRLAVLLRELVNRGFLADVVKNPETSYKRPMN